ncbi:hypothetical protein Fmac_004841 [Flemingia macrophylla]|uniref:Uncharacterized protein n=1 Tax=Flemingia macrophylla TaxID=520843 RepID=A0ABD1N621_9FABA
MSLLIELFNLNPTCTSLSLTKHHLILSLLLANALNLLSAVALKHHLNIVGTLVENGNLYQYGTSRNLGKYE